jgi:hypothetical protein
MRKLLTDILCVAFVVMGMVACSDDENDVPSYITDFLMVSVDANGKVTSVRLDDSTTYQIAAQQFSVDVKDTVLRCKATYTHDTHKDFKLYGLSYVYSERPYPASSFYWVVNGEVYRDVSLLPRDPMKVISMWKSGGYLNMHLGLMTTDNGYHQYFFCEDSVGHFSLLHQRPANDGSSYTKDVYMSMPIPEGLDSLTFSVTTYDGIYTRTF